MVSNRYPRLQFPLAAGSQEPAGRENLPTGATSAVAEQAIGSDHGDQALAGERSRLLDDPVVSRGGVDHMDPWVVAYGSTLPLVLTWPAVEDDPDLWVARVGEPLHPLDEATLCRHLPPARAVTPEQDSGMENIESVDNEKGRRRLLVRLCHKLSVLSLSSQISSLPC